MSLTFGVARAARGLQPAGRDASFSAAAPATGCRVEAELLGAAAAATRPRSRQPSLRGALSSRYQPCSGDGAAAGGICRGSVA